MRKPRVLFALLTTCCGLCALAPSMAYEDDGHFYTIIASERLSNKLNAPHDEAALYSFCAQLPDLAKELDATTLRYGVLLNPSWAWRDECDDETLHMVIIAKFGGSIGKRLSLCFMKKALPTPALPVRERIKLDEPRAGR